MTTARIIMYGVALVAFLAGAWLLHRNRRATREASRYARRVGGAMLVTLGLTLFLFSTVYSAATRS